MVKKYPDYEIYNLDNLTYAGELSKHRAIEKKNNYHFIKADINDQKAIICLFENKKFDFIVHFAAESHVDRSIIEPEIFVQTNVLGTYMLLQAAYQVGIEKIIHVSTDEVYGQLEYNPQTFFTEESPLQPSSPYSASKASSDLLVLAYYKTFGLPINITRCSNNYGPYQFPEKLIPLTILNVLNNRKVQLYGNGQNVRDWLHVFDHCTAIDLILHEGVNGEVYNIGGHNEHSNLKVVEKIISLLGKSEKLIEYVEDRLGHDKRYAINPEKVTLLGWEPKYSFELGIKETIQWYVQNMHWWQPTLNKNSVKFGVY